MLPEVKHQGGALLKAVRVLAAGAAMPIFSLVIGRMVNTLGYGGTDGLTAQLNQTTLFFLYLAIASFVVCYLEVGMWMLTGVLSLEKAGHPDMALIYVEVAAPPACRQECEALSGDPSRAFCGSE